MANDEAWEKIFSTKKFDLSQNLHFITATEIKDITAKEARILAKTDSSTDLPAALKRNGYFLLPVKNGKYAIVRGNGFHLIEKTNLPIKHISRIKFHLTTAGRGKGEMQYLDYSFNSGALESILGISPLYQSIRGREYSRAFNFKINSTQINVQSIQLEVDSGLEGEDSILLIEAKIPTPEDFIVRQLFYPYNHFKIVAPEKKIIPIFFTYEPTSKIYNFWIYEFSNPSDYNSIHLRKQFSLTIDTSNEIKLNDIRPTGVVTYKNLIPQANDLNKVIELVFKSSEGLNNYKDIATYFGFNERQSSYYREAAEALGLVASKSGKYYLTDIGHELVSLPVEKRNLFLVKILMDFSLIKESLDLLQSKRYVEKNDLEKIILSSSALTGSTISRRADSLIAWLRWIGDVTGSFMYENGIIKIK